MTLETYRWVPESTGRKPVQRCEYEDCFTCPYPDCIASCERIYELERLERSRQEQEGAHGTQHTQA